MTANVITIDAALADDRIEVGRPAAALADAVLGRAAVVILKGVFPRRQIDCLREQTFAWGRLGRRSTPDEFYTLARQNHYCVQRGISRVQKTLHDFRSYNLNRIDELQPPELRSLLYRFCVPLRRFWNALTGNDAEFLDRPQVLHPQILHYPAGGGFFARHTHPLAPQKIGMIVSLSQRGEDFRRGGTGFEIGDTAVEIEERHAAGDVALFRYDLPHWVSPIDVEEAMDEHSPRGRWVLVLPYY